LLDVTIDDALLFRVGIEDGGAVMLAGVRPLTVQLRRVVHDGKENLEQAAIRDL
jgi:hypothetical protein